MKLAIIVAVILTLTACKSAPVIIPDDITPQELIQKGQDAFQKGKYKNAEQYYQVAVDRYGDNTPVYLEARYEIGHIYMKQKRYKEAENIFLEIKEIFENSIAGTLPAAYNKLADIELEKIPENKKAAEAKAAAEKKEQESVNAPDVY